MRLCWFFVLCRGEGTEEKNEKYSTYFFKSIICSYSAECFQCCWFKSFMITIAWKKLRKTGNPGCISCITSRHTLFLSFHCLRYFLRRYRSSKLLTSTEILEFPILRFLNIYWTLHNKISKLYFFYCAKCIWF